MGIHKRSDGKFYVRCDWFDCKHNEVLEAKDFMSASAEARRKGWILKRDPKTGQWVNFHTEFCWECYTCPQKKIRISKKLPPSTSTY